MIGNRRTHKPPLLAEVFYSGREGKASDMILCSYMGYLYFRRCLKGYYDQLYRVPDNGLSFVDNFDKLERYAGQGQWSGETKLIQKVIDEYVTGDFSPPADTISSAEAIELQKTIDGGDPL